MWKKGLYREKKDKTKKKGKNMGKEKMSPNSQTVSQ